MRLNQPVVGIGKGRKSMTRPVLVGSSAEEARTTHGPRDQPHTLTASSSAKPLPASPHRR